MNGTRIHALAECVGATVSGQYTLLRGELRCSRAGAPYQVLNLADCSGHLTAYVWENSGLVERLPVRTPVPVAATLCVRQLDCALVANVTALRELAVHEIDNAVSLWPLSRCPEAARAAFAELVDFAGQLQPKSLRGFLNRVFSDPRIAARFMTCKASQRHHHLAFGGLLIHSVEVMAIAAAMARDRLDPLEQGITQVAALLHDLGKLRTVGAGTVRPVHYLLASHEVQTLRLLDPHLEWLRDRDPASAAGTEYILSFLAAPAGTRGRARFLGAELVASADRESAGLDGYYRLTDLLAAVVPGYQPAAAHAACRLPVDARSGPALSSHAHPSIRGARSRPQPASFADVLYAPGRHP